MRIERKHLSTGEVGREVERVETYRVELPPGAGTGLHVHPGGVSGYIVSGRAAYQLEGQDVEELSAGSGFFEPAGARVARFDNLSATEPVVFVAHYLLSGDQELLVPVE
ncbi:cupin domain-containing protein [Fodinicola acaciae]|uniref:cupin domain-containing protein n=1 Tax=Fodinicola acaciae TaxID=2681555 RepID=UPI0013D58815|nr:cupin domain-containing protein [Fodinicola acaciae]